jgi:hypothetical protein
MNWYTNIFLSESKLEERYKICRTCSYFTKFTKICSVCRCFMPAKVKLPMAECPMGKWKKELQ